MPDLRGVALAAGLAALLADGGGYAPRAWGWAALAAAGGALAALLVRRRGLGGPAAWWVGLLAAAGVFALLSAAWSRSPPSSVAEAQRTAAVVAVALLAATAFRRAEAWLVGGAVLAAAAAVCALNLVHRARGGYDERLVGAAAEPVGYDNALGLVAALGALLALGLCVETTQARAVRFAAGATLPLTGVVLVLAESTGAWGALAAGAAVAGIVHGRRLRAAGVAALVVLSVAAVVSFGGHERERYWPVALEAAREHPVAGAGAGTFWQLWLRERELPLSARDAHGLYVETLGEQGVVGLVLLAAALVLPLLAGRRGPPLLAGAYAAFVAALALDWHWELSGVAAAGTLLGGSLLLGSRQAADEELVLKQHKLLGAAPLALAALLVAAGAVTLAGAVSLERSQEELREHRPAAAADAARTAARLAPWAAEPWFVAAQSESAAGDAAAAAAAARSGLERDANDWRLWLELGRAATGAERERALARARSLNPLGPVEP